MKRMINNTMTSNEIAKELGYKNMLDLRYEMQLEGERGIFNPSAMFNFAKSNGIIEDDGRRHGTGNYPKILKEKLDKIRNR